VSNMEKWNKLKVPPPNALKKIKGGRLSGMSDINPQWRYEVMTEHFGMCGVGWKYEIDRIWTEPAYSDQIAQFAQVKLYIKDGESWSDAIPAVGGSMFIAKESKGLHVSDEAVKMAVTDALGTAMKMLGVASEVYRGNMDGSKYSGAMNKKEEIKPKTAPPQEPQRDMLGLGELLVKMKSSANAFELKARRKKYAPDFKLLDKDDQAQVKEAGNIRQAELDGAI